MQTIAPVTTGNLLAAGQRPLMKLEIETAPGVWTNISNLGSKNYLKDISFSSGGARMSPNPMAAQFSAIISNEGSIFHPSHPTSAYRDYFQAGKRTRISIGAIYSDIRDDFDDATIGAEWTTHNLDANKTIVEAGGVMTIAIANNASGDWWATLNDSPKAYMQIPSGPGVFITKLNNYVVNDKTHAGIFIADDVTGFAPNHSYIFGRYKNTGTAKDGLLAAYTGAGDSSYVAVTTLPIWLKVEVTGEDNSDVIFSYSIDGIAWTELHTASNYYQEGQHIGLFSKNFAPAWNNISAPFEYFEMEGDQNFYWQRIIGVMDEPKFSVDKYELTIKGLDYTKTLSDIKFTKEIQGVYPGTGNTPIDNYWGSVHTVSTVATSIVLGGQLYNEVDALDIVGDANNIANWAVVVGCVIAAVVDGVGAPPSVNQILITKDAPAGPILGNAENDSPPLAVVLGTKYRVSYYWRQVNQAGNPGNLKLGVYASGGAGALIAESAVVTDPGLPYTKTTFDFTSTITGNVKVMLTVQGGANSAVSFYVDDIDFQDLVLGANTPYQLPVGSTGVYYVELDNQDGAGFQPVWPGKQKGEGWYYDMTTRWFSFDEDKFIEAGTNNLHIWYFEAVAVENILADILVKAALYANRAAALAAMGAPATGVDVDRVWFESGDTYLNSIKKLCERTNYRFSFKYDGDAKFITAPTAGLASYRFGAPEVKSPSLYQDRNEILNRIVIEGDKVAELVGWEENMPSELKDEANDATSITAYGEHTQSIKNHLFQDLTSITAMCATLLVAYKDPKWYSRFNAPYSGVPLELYDSAGMMEILDVSLVAGKFVYHGGIIRSIDISKYNTTYKIEVENIYGQCMIVASCGDIADKYENASDADKSYAYVAPCSTMVFADGTPAMRVCKCS